MTIVGAALLRMLTDQVALPVFDLDPVLVSGGRAGLSIGPSLLLDALVLLAAAAGLAAERASGRGVRSGLVLLALLPALPLLLAMGGPLESTWRGMTWLASVVGGIALCHLLRDRGLRRMALAILLGGLTIVAVRGVAQILIEHPRTVAAFAAMREQFMADRGWGQESASLRVFENRLQQREATGWFGLSNVMSSAMVALFVLACGFATLLRRVRSKGTASGEAVGEIMEVWLVLAGLLGLLLVIFNGSKGAIASVLLGTAVLALPVIAGRPRRPLPASLGPCVAIGAPLLALLAVLLRGALLPSDLLGERSLLFRWHYLVDAATIVLRHPLLGVGPDGFQQAMVAVRPATHPEEVASAHNVAADWLAGFGVFGAAWIALLLVLLIWAGRRVTAVRTDSSAIAAPVADSAPGVFPPIRTTASRAAAAAPSGLHLARDVPPREEVDARLERLALACLLLVALAALWIESATLDPLLLLLRLLGILGSVLVLASVTRMLGGGLSPNAGQASDSAGVGAMAPLRWPIFAATVAVVSQAQIEMTFWLAGSIPWAMVLLSLAAPVPEPEPEPKPEPERSARTLQHGPTRWIALLLALAAMPAIALGWRAWSIESILRAAAEPLERLGAGADLVRSSMDQLGRSTDPATRARSAQDLAAALGACGAPAESIRSIVARLTSASAEDRAIAARTLDETLLDLEVEARLKAVRTLAPVAGRRDLRPVVALAHQSLRAAAASGLDAKGAVLRQALEQVDAAARMGSRQADDQRLIRARAELSEALAATGDADAAHTASETWEDLVRRDPASMALRLRAASAAGQRSDSDAERRHLEQVLEIDRALHLYPRRQLTPEQRAEVAARLKALSG